MSYLVYNMMYDVLWFWELVDWFHFIDILEAEHTRYVRQLGDGAV